MTTQTMLSNSAALIIATGFFAGSVMIFLGLSRLTEAVDGVGDDINFAGKASRPPYQLDVTLSGDTRQPLLIQDAK